MHDAPVTNTQTNKQTVTDMIRYRHVWIESLNVTVLCTFFSVTTSNELVQQVRPSPGTVVYPHMPNLRPHASLFHERCNSSVTFRRRVSAVMFTSQWTWPARWPIRPILGFWGAKFTKMCFPALDQDELPHKI